MGLVVEVADTSLDADREMARVYGASGVPIYWIVNVREYLIEVFAEPTSDGYGSKREYKPGEDVPVVLDGAEVGRIAISDLLRYAPLSSNCAYRSSGSASRRDHLTVRCNRGTQDNRTVRLRSCLIEKKSRHDGP